MEKCQIIVCILLQIAYVQLTVKDNTFTNTKRRKKGLNQYVVELAG